MLSEEFEEYLGAMYERAHQRFRESGESRLLRRRLDDCEAACLQNVHPNDHFFVHDLLEALADAESAEAEYLYRQGYADCVESLKQLHVL